MNACTVRQRRGSVKGSVYINCSSRQTEKMLSVHGASAKQKQKARTVTIEVWENMSEMKWRSRECAGRTLTTARGGWRGSS